MFRTQAKRAALDEYVSTAARAAKDVDRKGRTQQALCLSCFYTTFHPPTGRSTTYRSCSICPEALGLSNMNDDVVCIPCAKTHSLCRRCGSDFDLRPRWRLFGWLKKKK